MFGRADRSTVAGGRARGDRAGGWFGGVDPVVLDTPGLEQADSHDYSTGCFQWLRKVTSRAGRLGAGVNVSPV
jgi:hypothetical protein